MMTQFYKPKAILLLLALFLTVVGRPQSNQYLHFDRVDDWVKVENGESYVTNSTQGVTMAGWFFSDDLSYGQGMMGFRGGSTEFYMIQIGDGKLECRYISSTGFHEYVGPAMRPNLVEEKSTCEKIGVKIKPAEMMNNF